MIQLLIALVNITSININTYYLYRYYHYLSIFNLKTLVYYNEKILYSSYIRQNTIFNH